MANERELYFDVKFEIQDEEFKVIFGNVEVISTRLDNYEGPYQVTPQLDNAVVLATKDKSMTDNVTVRKIPWEEVSNPQGGLTVTIGGY